MSFTVDTGQAQQRDGDGYQRKDRVSMAAVRDLDNGTVLADRYVIEEYSDQGWNAYYYLAEDRKLNRKVMIKIFRPEDLGNTHKLTLFQESRDIAVSLEHSHIVTVYDAGEYQGRPYFVSRYYGKDNLSKAIEQQRQLPLDDQLKLLEEIADALDYAHGKKRKLHGDLKPINILLDERGLAHINDFKPSASLSDIDMTKQSSNSYLFMSLERLNGENPVQQSDIFSFAVIAFYLLSSKYPFSESLTLEQHLQARTDKLPLMSEACQTFRTTLDAVFERALSSNIEDRPKTAGDFVQELRTAINAPPLFLNVFFSHSSKNKKFAHMLKRDLQVLGVTVWIDDKGILVGENFDEVIQRAIETCDAMLILVTSEANRSDYIAKEIDTARALGKPILPLQCENCERHPRLSSVQYADFVHEYRLGLESLVVGLNAKQPVNSPPVTPK